MANQVAVEVVYTNGYQQWIIPLQVANDSTLACVIQQSGILALCSDIDLAKQRVGIYGCQRSLTDQVQAGDRIEIYRPLIADPREIRRQRAAQQASTAIKGQ
ncbi:MAG: RnfH family protein [Candidatus Symbiodolus clandestinus]